MSAAYVSSAMVGDMGREVDKELGVGERGETAVEDEIFDIMINDNDFDTDFDKYLI